VSPPKSREAPALCGGQDFFGLTFFVTFLCQDKKVKIEDDGFTIVKTDFDDSQNLLILDLDSISSHLLAISHGR